MVGETTFNDSIDRKLLTPAERLLHDTHGEFIAYVENDYNVLIGVANTAATNLEN